VRSALYFDSPFDKIFNLSLSKSIVLDNCENRIVNRGGLAKYCPRSFLSVANRRVDVQQNTLNAGMELQ